jgi:hypothetical protein
MQLWIIRVTFLIYMTTEKQFLIEHNSMAPPSLKANMEMLSSFKKEKPSLFVDGNCPIEKIRRPFIFWLTSRPNKAK